jgi:prephenate dehydrogenase
VSPAFERISILGLGLLGGSLGLAIRERGVARQVVGVGRRAQTLAEAEARGAADLLTQDPAAAVRGADLVVLATPPLAMPGVLRACAPGLGGGTLVTDVASVKALLCGVLPGLLPPGVSYLGSHPMAGSHRTGIQHARADLFEGSTCVLTPGPDSEPEAVERLAGFWQALGARVVERDAEEHDAEAGWVSHVPHALAFAFARALAAAPRGAAEVRGAGFRDFTRIARGDAELWSEILVANRKALAGSLQEFQMQLAELTRALEAGEPEAVTRFLQEAGAALLALESAASPNARSGPARAGGENPEIPTAGGSHQRSFKHRT